MTWIKITPVTMPKENEEVLVYSEEGICRALWRDYVDGFSWSFYPMGDFATGSPLNHVTHWQPLPPPPEIE